MFPELRHVLVRVADLSDSLSVVVVRSEEANEAGQDRGQRKSGGRLGVRTELNG